MSLSWKKYETGIVKKEAIKAKAATDKQAKRMSELSLNLKLKLVAELQEAKVAVMEAKEETREQKKLNKLFKAKLLLAREEEVKVESVIEEADLKLEVCRNSTALLYRTFGKNSWT